MTARPAKQDCELALGPAPRPIIFLGPSMPLVEARSIIDADFRPPCQRGDFANIPGGAVVGLIDGVFAQNDAVSPRELVYALERGVTIWGASSMGALRAVEVPGVTGVGRVYEMFKTGLIDSDDEVTLLFDAERFVPITTPLVNVRHAVERLVRSATIDPAIGSALVVAAARLHYRDRTYRRILSEAGLDGRADAPDLMEMLRGFDLKREDARLLLERLHDHVAIKQASTVPAGLGVQSRPDYGPPDQFGSARAAQHGRPDAPVLIWEIGGVVDFAELLLFLKLTGDFTAYAQRALFRFLALGGSLTREEASVTPLQEEVKYRALEVYRTWGWGTPEEINATLNDLGMGSRDLAAHLAEAVGASRVLAALARQLPERFCKALRAELVCNDLALKRETMRRRSLTRLAATGGGASLTEEELESARRTLCRRHGGVSWKALCTQLDSFGVNAAQRDEFLRQLASARRFAQKVASAPGSDPAIDLLGIDTRFGLTPGLKPLGEPRFSRSLGEAHTHALRLKDLIGVTRVAMVNGYCDIPGVYVSQAARPTGVWSSTYGSGKSPSHEGAVIGAIMEETEKWAQEQFKGSPLWGSYEELCLRENTLDPALLDLPYDSRYHPSLELAWQRCVDLLQGRDIYVPLAALTCSSHAGRNNIYFSERGARVTFSTNGLASGFTLAEALVHGVCELIERHAARMAELCIENPGLPSRWRPRRIVPGSLPGFVRELVASIEQSAGELSLWDITSDIAVPTVYARLVKDRELAQGWACHANPAVAAHMALLEAVQTLVGATAAGREDLTIKARSLGRHERTTPLRTTAQAFWHSEDDATLDVSALGGFVTNDDYAELQWLRERLVAAGLKHLISVDLTLPEMLPARAVRVLIPGIETNNPFYTGPRAQMTLLAELLPHVPRNAAAT